MDIEGELEEEDTFEGSSSFEASKGLYSTCDPAESVTVQKES